MNRETMDPASHILVPVTLLAVYSISRYRHFPNGDPILVVVFAALLPDLIDKPLAWTFAFTPSGRLIAHSLVVAIPAVVGIVLAANRLGYSTYGNLFAFGYLSHIVLDSYPVLYLGTDYYFFPNMLWPFVPPNPDFNTTFTSHLLPLDPTTLLVLGVVVIICGYAVVDSVQRRRKQAR